MSPELAEALRREIRAALEADGKPFDVNVARRVYDLAIAARDMCVAATGTVKEAIAQIKDTDGPMEALDAPDTPESQVQASESFGARLLRELMAAFPVFQGPRDGDPKQLVHALAEARRSGMSDVAEQLEVRLLGRAMTGSRPVLVTADVADDSSGLADDKVEVSSLKEDLWFRAGQAAISLFRSKSDVAPRREDLSWERLAEMFREPRRTSCTVANCPSMNALVGARGERLECPHKDGACWSPVVYLQGVRKKAFVEAVHFLVIDFDHLSDERLVVALASLAGHQRIVHATHSDRSMGEVGPCACGSGTVHGTGCPARVDRCVRAILALNRPVRSEEWSSFWRAAMKHLQLPADVSCGDVHRQYLRPSRPSDARNYLFEFYEGEVLDVDWLLASIAGTRGLAAEVIEKDRLAGRTSQELRDEIISKVGMMAAARTPEMQARYDAAVERERSSSTNGAP